MDEKLRRRFLLYARLPVFKRRVQRARERVAQWLDLVKNPYIAFSTGKDSTCILHLVREQRPDIPAVYFDADCSYPESRQTLESTPNTIAFPTEEPLLETFRRFGNFESGPKDEAMRTTVWEPIKRLLKKYNFDGVCYGLRSEENPKTRGAHARYHGAVFQYKRDGLWGCQPIHDWEYNDVWAYIVVNNLPYCGVYDKLWDSPEEDQRLSYWAGVTKRRYGRLAWLKRCYPELFNRLAAEFPEARGYV